MMFFQWRGLREEKRFEYVHHTPKRKKRLFSRFFMKNDTCPFQAKRPKRREFLPVFRFIESQLKENQLLLLSQDAARYI
jgi:hypothetical protein